MLKKLESNMHSQQEEHRVRTSVCLENLKATCRVSKKNTDGEDAVQDLPRQSYQRSSAKASTSGRGANPRSLEEVHARLLVDCMGHWSPIVQQIRGPKKPDGMCLVVGGCATGFPPEANESVSLHVKT